MKPRLPPDGTSLRKTLDKLRGGGIKLREHGDSDPNLDCTLEDIEELKRRGWRIERRGIDVDKGCVVAEYRINP
jgi:hypothetical protein